MGLRAAREFDFEKHGRNLGREALPRGRVGLWWLGLTVAVKCTGLILAPAAAQFPDGLFDFGECGEPSLVEFALVDRNIAERLAKLGS